MDGAVTTGAAACIGADRVALVLVFVSVAKRGVFVKKRPMPCCSVFGSGVTASTTIGEEGDIVAESIAVFGDFASALAERLVAAPPKNERNVAAEVGGCGDDCDGEPTIDDGDAVDARRRFGCRFCGGLLSFFAGVTDEADGSCILENELDAAEAPEAAVVFGSLLLLSHCNRWLCVASRSNPSNM